MVWRAALWILAVGSLLAVCSANPVSPRAEPYRPNVAPENVLQSVREKMPPASLGALAMKSDAADVGSAGAVISDEAGLSSRRLRKGDRIVISKLGIPQPETIKEVIDEHGNVNLSLVGSVKVDGLTTAEAEAAIEQAYVEGGYYRKINVVVVPEEYPQYFVRGEVKAPGRYPVTAGLTLLRAIAASGGYTDFANSRRISIYRGSKVLRFDATKIENLKEQDPPIEPEDVIVVERKLFL